MEAVRPHKTHRQNDFVTAVGAKAVGAAVGTKAPGSSKTERTVPGHFYELGSRPPVYATGTFSKGVTTDS